MQSGPLAKRQSGRGLVALVIHSLRFLSKALQSAGGRKGFFSLRRGFLIVLVSILIFQAVSSAICPRVAAGKSESRAPILILEEPETSGLPTDLGGSKDSDGRDILTYPHPMVSRLAKDGYELGTDMFILTSADPFYSLQAGGDWVNRAVSFVLSKTGASSLDIIAYGVTGLVARCAIESGVISHLTVGDLVMVSSPNRGTFVAEFLKTLITRAVLESMWEKGTRVQRYLQLFSGGDEAKAGENSLRRWVPEDTPWEDEISWIISRSESVYEPLYARYVAERYFSIPYVPIDSPNKTFAGWLSENAPRMWEDLIQKGIDPPTVAGSAGDKTLRPGLSSAYYELLAMDVARNQYVIKTSPQKGLLDSLFSGAYVPVDLKDAAFYYGERLLWHFAGKALGTIKAETQEWLAERLLKAAGFGGEPASPLLGALVRERVLVNLGKSLGKRFERVISNVSLASTNELSGSESAGRTTRYVSVAGQTLNPWGITWPQIGPNDLYCEVDCAVAPLGPLDIVQVIDGWFSPSHEGLRKNKKAQDFITSVLKDSCEKTPYVVKSASAGSLLSWATVSSWRPTYFVAETGENLVDRVVMATVSVADPPSGWQYMLWTEDSQGVVHDRKVQSFGGTVDVEFCDGDTLGVRLTRSGPANPVGIGGRVESAFSKEVHSRVQISVQSVPTSVGGDPGATGSLGPGVGQEPGNEPGQTTYLDGTGTGGAGETDSAADPKDLPLVRVVYRSKQTTLKEPSETYHEWWSIDWGDGKREAVAGQVSLEMTHRYAKEGEYEATFTSYDSHGGEILEKTFGLNVTGDSDYLQTISCKSVPRVDVNVMLTGPSKWITGKPAEYKGRLWADLPQNVEFVELTYDPGESFHVLWERAGDFVVSVAATAKLRYIVEDKEITVKNTYVQSMPVIVLTTGVTR